MKVWLRRLDFLPPRAAWALGLGGGALAGAAFAGAAPGAVGILGFLALLGAAAGLAASGEPIAVLDRADPDAKPSLVDLVEIPGGSFLMGSPEDEEGRQRNEGPVHEVQISPFACMRFPVTRRLYTQTLGQKPGEPESPVNAKPVNHISWFDAVEFCNRLSEWEGIEPCYRLKDKRVYWNRAANGYRLLTEAEWEYACRAGTTTRWFCGDNQKQLGDYAWFDANSLGKTQPVGSKLPNAWGLHDMHGNVLEWCWNWIDRYTAKQQIDPAGPEEGSNRSLRGGSFFNAPRALRSANRFKALPTNRNVNFGFRCARNSRRHA